MPLKGAWNKQWAWDAVQWSWAVFVNVDSFVYFFYSATKDQKAF